MDECIGQVWELRPPEFAPHLQVHHPPGQEPRGNTPWTLSVRVLWRLHDVTQLIKSLAISDQSIRLQPLSLLSGEAESSNPLIICLVANSPPSSEPIKVTSVA